MKRIFNNKNAKLVLSFLFSISMIGISFILVYDAGFKSGLSQTKIIKVRGVTNINDKTVDFSTFWQAWNILKSNYFDSKKVSDDKKLMYGAISGLFATTGDPHTIFFPPTDAHRFKEDISGQFQGIGAEIGIDKKGNLAIIAPLKSTPAYKAGLESGDIIEKIDGKTTRGISIYDAVDEIRGKKGSTVTLTISRNGWNKTKDIKIVRDTIAIPTIESKRFSLKGEENKNGKIAYIRLYNFDQKSSALFYKTAIKLATSYNKPKGIILDLRDNPGGYLTAAISISGWFVNKGDKIVTEEFQNKANDKTFISYGPAVFNGIPVVVLINKGSASASEITAGALKERDNAVIAGETSFGKGTVQEVKKLSDGSLAKVTIAHWLTPDGTSINGVGIKPSIYIKNTDENSGKYNIKNDNEILKAIKILSEKITKN